MAMFFDLETIRSRGAAINLKPSTLAKMAGVSPTSVTRSNEVQAVTAKKLTSTLLAEEARLREHLAAVSNGEGAAHE
jgi:hypothetical protein